MTDLHPSPTILSVLEEELNRIVLDVHDGPVQNLFAALSLLTRLEQEAHELAQCNPDTPTMTPQIQQITRIIENSLHEIKSFLGTFRSPGFHQRPMDKLIRSLVMQHEDWTGQQIELTTEHLPDILPLPIKISLYRILQEALSNGYRHAGTDVQFVRVWKEGGMIHLLVEDQGKGFTPPTLNAQDESSYTAHIGLLGMQERVALLGGTFQLSSQVGQGTSILVKVPLYE